jgi:asparagine synthase (glutamine-hydrolysing)
VEWAWSLPKDYKVQGTMGKRILRDVLYRYVPPKIMDRPKMGFGVPVGQWLRQDLRGWAEDLLSEASLSEILEPKPVRDLWSKHLQGQSGDGQLWSILMLQAWRQRWVAQVPQHDVSAEHPIRLSAR